MLIGLGSTGLGVPTFAETNAVNAQANVDLLSLANAVASYMARKGYAVTLAKRAGGTGGQYLLTDVYEVYVNNVPAYAGKIAGIITASDLSTSASQLGDGFLSSLEWNAMYSGKAIEYPTAGQEVAKTSVTATPASIVTVANTPKLATAQTNLATAQSSRDPIKIALAMRDVALAIRDQGTTQGTTPVNNQSTPVTNTTPVVASVAAASAGSVTDVANGTTTTKDLAYYMDMLKQSDIIPGVPNWAILGGVVGLLWLMNKDKRHFGGR